MKLSRKLKITLIVIGAVVVIMLGLAGWAYVDVVRYNELIINDVNLEDIADGVYEGSFDGGRFSNSVAVTVKDHKIVDVKKLKPSAPAGGIYQKIYTKVIEEQSLQIDTVSGASVTTLTTLKAIENALSR